ncbi:LacI family DNA-binding transcriptional regulator [Pseudonocardia humida]|uniref:LacI family DNA-binding transcriptional regulator n=1 Tax=Pseudonocardia humida TaxID=2800819 RepID=A0ABT1ACV6_9PSEU|nr:LacI family DNA-binding transcriptional regulator [Pseudonocardia humida]MCO1660833.1 LacI family DNA-binding transcriptional regulator [Pseudonocardia humida]MCO1661029.1 LacI family DNA-binding transcriptional regulator [Pseudonocardia humida]
MSTARGRRITSADVAREAGVSRATVSYVLNDKPGQAIPDATRRRVRDAAARLGYAPSATATALRRGRSDVVLGLLPDWPLGHALGRVVQEVTAAFARSGLTFVLHPDSRAVRPMGEVWKAITPVAVLAFDALTPAEAAAMRAAGVEVVVTLHSPVEQRPGELLQPQDPVGGLQARHLAPTHRRLGYAYPDDDRVAVFARPRLQGVRDVCTELGLPAPDVRTVPLQPRAAAEAVRSWLAADPPVTGICAYNDEVAMAVLTGARRLGVRVPEELAVVGVDDVPAAAVADPPLTTVVQDYRAIAEHHVRSVVAVLAGEPIPGAPVKDECRLEIRASA